MTRYAAIGSSLQNPSFPNGNVITMRPPGFTNRFNARRNATGSERSFPSYPPIPTCSNTLMHVTISNEPSARLVISAISPTTKRTSGIARCEGRKSQQLTSYPTLRSQSGRIETGPHPTSRILAGGGVKDPTAFKTHGYSSVRSPCGMAVERALTPCGPTNLPSAAHLSCPSLSRIVTRYIPLRVHYVDKAEAFLDPIIWLLP